MAAILGLIIILLGALAAVPISAHAQQRGTAGDVSESLSSGQSIARAANSSFASEGVPTFTLTSLNRLPDRDILDCVSGPRCVFFPDRIGHQPVAAQNAVNVDPVSVVFDQKPVPPSSSPSTPAITDPRPDLPAPDVSGPGSKSKMNSPDRGFEWGNALVQSLLFLGIEHGVRFAFDPPTRRALDGPFWNDYVNSLKSLKTWHDNNSDLINYLGHPMQGAITGYIQIQNDPKGKRQSFGSSRGYWTSRMKAMAWSAGYGAFFELGFPISEAAVGNLGIKRPPDRPKLGYVDLVITPTLGTAWVIAEDAIDLYLVRAIERKTQSQTWRAISRSVLNPMRTVANIMRFKYPWYRDDLSR